VVPIVIKNVVAATDLIARRMLAPKLEKLDRLRDDLDHARATKKMEDAQKILMNIRQLADEIDALSCGTSTPGTDR